MAFVDDNIICCDGKFPTIYTIMREAFKLFSNSSGLQISEQKSDFYIAGMDMEII